MVIENLWSGGSEAAPLLYELGYDYIELSISHLSLLDKSSFRKVRENLKLPCESCNNLFPPDLRLTGPDVNFRAVKEYSELALGRAAEMGSSIIVFGSGQAKSYPEGFPASTALEQVKEICYQLSSIASRNNQVIVVEHLRKAECNLINTFEEAIELCRSVNLDEIKVLADLYHLTEEKESISGLKNAGEYLKHIHISNPSGRKFPLPVDDPETYRNFFEMLKMIEYKERISIEAYSSDFEKEAASALKFLKNLIKNYMEL